RRNSSTFRWSERWWVGSGRGKGRPSFRAYHFMGVFDPVGGDVASSGRSIDPRSKNHAAINKGMESKKVKPRLMPALASPTTISEPSRNAGKANTNRTLAKNPESTIIGSTCQQSPLASLQVASAATAG